MDASILLDNGKKINSHRIAAWFLLAITSLIPYNTSWIYIELMGLELRFLEIQNTINLLCRIAVDCLLLHSL
jgi:hypothetical protein